MPDHVHQVGGVAAVVDREGGIEADLGGVLAQDAGADGVEGAGPAEAGGQGGGLVAEDRAGDALDAALHLRRGASGEGHQQDAARVGARKDQVGDAVRQRVGLAGAGAGDDQQRAGDLAVAVQDGRALGFVQPVEVAGVGAGGTGDHVHPETRSCSAFVLKQIRWRIGSQIATESYACGVTLRGRRHRRSEERPSPGSASRACRRCAGSVARRTLFRRGKLHPGGQQKATI